MYVYRKYYELRDCQLYNNLLCVFFIFFFKMKFYEFLYKKNLKDESVCV